jgi:glycosyltransferase involved in cell wall biosynthesis
MFICKGIVDEGRADRILGSGVDLARFAYTPMSSERPLKFIFVGRLLIEKGINIYVEAADILKREYPSIEFSVLGPIDIDNPGGITREDVSKWTDSVNYLGTTDNVPRFMSDYDVVVLPSYYKEGVPKSLLEAAAMGKVIVTTDNVGCRDAVLDGVTGYLCESKSLNSLVHAIDRVINLKYEDILEMQAHARALAENSFDERIGINKYIEVTVGSSNVA